jgi:hypothetical protein
MLFNAIGQPRWNSPLVRFFGMKIGGAAAPSLAPEIAPSFDVNQMDDPQLLYLRGERRGGYGGILTAAVGFYGTAAIRNPAGSGILVIVESVLASVTGNPAYYSISQISDLTSAGSANSFDARYGTNSQTTARYTFRNDSAGPLTGARLGVIPAGQMDPINVGAVLPPNYAFIVETANVNAQMIWAISFRERAIPAEELATG